MTRAMLPQLEGHAGGVWGCAVDPQGRWIVSASKDETLRVWDAETGAMLRQLEGHTKTVWVRGGPAGALDRFGVE